LGKGRKYGEKDTKLNQFRQQPQKICAKRLSFSSIKQKKIKCLLELGTFDETSKKKKEERFES
jgi:hypothetical protein